MSESEIGGQDRDIRRELAKLREDIRRLADDLSQFEVVRSGIARLTTELEAKIRHKPLVAVVTAAAAGYCVIKPWTALALGAAYFARRSAPALLNPRLPSPQSDIRPSWEYWPGSR